MLLADLQDAGMSTGPTFVEEEDFDDDEDYEWFSDQEPVVEKKRKGVGKSDELWWSHVQTLGNDFSLLVITITIYWVALSSSGFQKDRYLR